MVFKRIYRGVNKAVLKLFIAPRAHLSENYVKF